MGTDGKRQTLILGGNADREAMGPRNALPPPPHIRRSVVDDDETAAVDSGWEGDAGPQLFLASSLPPPPTDVDLPREPEELSSSELVEDDRPSDRVTVPNELAPKKVIERVLAERASEPRSLATTRPPPPCAPDAAYAAHAPTLEELASSLESHPLPRLELTHPDEAFTPSSVPPVSVDVRPPLTSLPGQVAQSVPVPKVSRRWLAVFAASHVLVAASVLLGVYLTRPEAPARAREPRVAQGDRSRLESAAGAVLEDATPAEGCRVQDLSRVIAAHAEVGPPLDAAALESGFGVGLVSRSHEATGIRLEASTLRTAETVRVRSLGPVTRVGIDRGDTEDERLEVRIDDSDTKTLGPTRKISALRGAVFEDDGAGSKLLWAIPGWVPKTPETVRATSRSDGSALVAVRRPGIFWVGVTGSGPLVPLVRERRTLGTPALAAAARGGVVAWAERETGAFSVVVAMVEADGKRTAIGAPVAIAEGISPALAGLPSGELLLVYSDGKAGAHRVVAQRLGADLTARGERLVLSPRGSNAGQPAVAVDAEGRAIVAYLALEGGHAEVHATALSCR